MQVLGMQRSIVPVGEGTPAGSHSAGYQCQWTCGVTSHSLILHPLSCAKQAVQCSLEPARDDVYRVQATPASGCCTRPLHAGSRQSCPTPR